MQRDAIEGRKPLALDWRGSLAVDDRWGHVEAKALAQCPSLAGANPQAFGVLYPGEGEQEAIRPPARSGKNRAAGKHFAFLASTKRLLSYLPG